MKGIKTAAGVAAVLMLYSTAASAQLSTNGVLDQVVAEFATRASSWQTVVMNAASWLFWTLGTISLAWTGGMLILRKADIGEFFAEFVRFILFFGFFLWLLRNGPSFASSIIASLQQLGQNASGVGAVTPSSIVDVGFKLWKVAIDHTSMWSPIDSAIGAALSAGVMIILAVIAVNMLLLMVSAWIMMYAGVFFLGFGGSRWTSDMAINYYKTVLGVAVQLFTMVLLIGIGNDLLMTFYSQMDQGNINFQQMGVMLVFCVALLMLVNRVPPLVAGIITGASVGGAGGIGNFGAGAAVGAAMTAASMASGGAAMAGRAIMGGAASAAGGASAVKAAFDKAQSAMANGGDMPSFGGGGDDGGGMSSGGGSGGGSDAGIGDTPFAQAAGFDSTSAKDSSTTTGGFRRAAALAAGTAGELAKGAASQASEKFQERVKDTAGGRLASSIRESMQPAEGGEPEAGQFNGDSLGGAGSSESDDEVAAFRDRDSEQPI